MAQTLTTENALAWAARPEYVTSFTNDKTVLNVITDFLQWSKKETIPSENVKFSIQNGTRFNRILSMNFNLRDQKITYQSITYFAYIFYRTTSF